MTSFTPCRLISSSQIDGGWRCTVLFLAIAIWKTNKHISSSLHHTMYHCAFIECYLTQVKHKLIHFLFTVPSAWQHTGCHCLGDKELPPNPGIALGSFPSKQGSSSLLWKHTYTDNADSSSALTKRPDVKAKEKEKSHILLTRMTLLQKYMFSPPKIQKNKLYFENTIFKILTHQVFCLANNLVGIVCWENPSGPCAHVIPTVPVIILLFLNE